MNEKGNQRMDRVDWMDKIEWTGTHIYKNASSITYIVNYYPTQTRKEWLYKTIYYACSA